MIQNIDNSLKEAKSRLKTVRDFLRLGVSLFNQHKLFYGHGTTNAHDEAAYLILHSLNLPLDELEPYLDAILLDSEIDLILQRFSERVVSNRPAPYITKQAHIQGYEFYVDERAIIPRSFIPEILLADGLLPWIDDVGTVNNVLDLCTGNGSIAIIAHEYFYNSHVIASDIDSNALEVAQINIDRYQLQQKITLLQSNLWDSLPKQRFDVILTNPPYVDELRMQGLTKEYKHEPVHALAGGESGLDLVLNIVNNAVDYLTEDGILVVEMGDNQEQLENMYPGLAFTWLDTVSGDGIVFLLTYDQLYSYFNA